MRVTIPIIVTWGNNFRRTLVPGSLLQTSTAAAVTKNSSKPSSIRDERLDKVLGDEGNAKRKEGIHKPDETSDLSPEGVLGISAFPFMWVAQKLLVVVSLAYVRKRGINCVFGKISVNRGIKKLSYQLFHQNAVIIIWGWEAGKHGKTVQF
ncbi:13697_t:CDS:2 [Acaulospora colombiana]|uniref:13697_t:CDS:1 n=1 Tax=Acaulospora colombiana TaxID=27376 RepID=A0ACA9K1M4_9GLOM|nr:13697_t:CDS:2 [Acaulospora colombiana]